MIRPQGTTYPKSTLWNDLTLFVVVAEAIMVARNAHMTEASHDQVA